MDDEFFVTSSNPGRHPSHALVARADLVVRRASLPPVRVDTFGGAASVAFGRTAREELYVGRRDEDEEVVRLLCPDVLHQLSTTTLPRRAASIPHLRV